jgi:hypothetical protein
VEPMFVKPPTEDQLLKWQKRLHVEVDTDVQDTEFWTREIERNAGLIITLNEIKTAANNVLFYMVLCDAVNYRIHMLKESEEGYHRAAKSEH